MQVSKKSTTVWMISSFAREAIMALLTGRRTVLIAVLMRDVATVTTADKLLLINWRYAIGCDIWQPGVGGRCEIWVDFIGALIWFVDLERIATYTLSLPHNTSASSNRLSHLHFMRWCADKSNETFKSRIWLLLAKLDMERLPWWTTFAIESVARAVLPLSVAQLLLVLHSSRGAVRSKGNLSTWQSQRTFAERVVTPSRL